MGRSIHDDARKDGDAGRMLMQPIPSFFKGEQNGNLGMSRLE